MWLCLTLFISCEMNILNSQKIISSKFNYGVFISYYDTFFIITQKPRSHAHGIKTVMKCPSSFCSNLSITWGKRIWKTLSFTKPKGENWKRKVWKTAHKLDFILMNKLPVIWIFPSFVSRDIEYIANISNCCSRLF